jgi:hypothetical protein
LQIDDIDAIILACNFEYGTGPVNFRLRNEGLLIQGTHISVLNGDVPIVQRPPFDVYSNKVVKITKDEEEISFKPIIDFAEHGLNIARIKLRAYWDEFYARMQSTEYLNYASLIIEGIFAPRSIFGLILSCKRGIANKRKCAKIIRRSRQRNDNENIQMLNRNSRGSRR